MPHISDLLNRFRPIGPPGSASRAGIPVDRAAELAAELEPVLTMLAATQAQCAAVVAEAELRAIRIGSEANAQAAGIAEEGRDRAAAAHAAAADGVIAAAHSEADRVERSAALAARARRPLVEADVLALAELAVGIVQTAPDGLGMSAGAQS